jgi:hypothetical protein
MTDHSDAWHDLYDAIPRGWVVGRPPFDRRDNKWRLYGYSKHSARIGRPEIVLVEGESEEVAVREMTRVLREGRPGR